MIGILTTKTTITTGSDKLIKFVIIWESKTCYQYHKLRMAISTLFHRHAGMFNKYNVSLRTLLHQGTSEPVFQGDLVYKFKRIIGIPLFYLINSKR